MEQDNTPSRIPPPNSKDIVQSQNSSFFKKNWWVFLIAGVVMMFGLAGWYVTSKIRHAIKRYEALVRPDTTKDIITNLDTVYKEPYNPSIKLTKLTLSGGAAIYTLNDTTRQLFHADAVLFHGKYLIDSRNDDSIYLVDLSMKDRGKGNIWGSKYTDSVNFKLNAAPIWDIDINTGAADLNFDLSKFKMRNIILKGGAGQFVLKMGEPLSNSIISIETGASDVTINIPKDAACSIETSSSLSSNDFDGFTKKDDGHYETANFSNAKNEYHIRISGAISDYKIHRY